MDTLRQLADLQGREDNLVRKQAQLREELKDLDKLLEDVRIERRTLLDHSPLRPLISNHPPPRSPIYNLPVELLVMVFKHTVSGYEVGWQIALAEDFTPCKLVRVCHAWRKVALDTPYLWRFQFLNRPPTISKFLLLSKDLPFDIILLPTPGTPTMISSAKSYRWNSLFVVGTCQTYCLHIFASLDFEGRDFNRLSELDISCEDGFLAGRDYLRGPPPVLASSRFASLTTIKLSNICPTQLPTDTSFPSVESISLAFSPVLAPRASLVSGLCHFLARTPNVTELVLRHGPPLSDNITSASLPVSLSSLRHLEWEHAPPRDFWYLFCILDAPHLETFVLTLDDASYRWRKEDGISPIEVSSLLTPSLAELRHLVVTCRDDKPEFIKLHIPALETLKICHDDLCLEPLTFPALGSMFRDPRLVKLSELELCGFVLEENFVQDTLVYMKFLHKITLDSCQGLPAVVCALSCGDSCSTNIEKPRKWTCPRLTHLVLKNCSKSLVKCLEHTVRARRHHSEVEPPATRPDGRVIRRLKSRKNLTLSFTPPCTPRKQPLAMHNIDLPSTPNGSFVAGWPGQENARPCKIRTIEVSNCKRVSLSELWSFTSDEYGVEHVKWDEREV